MKMQGKKLLSILTALTLLVSVVLPAGVVSVSAAEAVPMKDDTVVTAIDFSVGSDFHLGGDGAVGTVFRVGGTTQTYTVAFEYYLPKVPVHVFVNDQQGGALVAGDKFLEAGHHTYVAQFKSSSGVFVPRINASKQVISTLYIWNVRVTLDGEDVNGTDEVYEPTSPAAIDRTKTLGDYEWSKNMDSPAVTEIHFTDTVTNFGTGFYYNGVDEASAYTLSFEYYLPKDVAAQSLYVNSVSGNMKDEKTHKYLETSAGHHSYSWTTYTTAFSGASAGQFVPRIYGAADTDLYIWNFSIKQNGKNIYANYSKLTAGEAAPKTFGENGKPLADYAWSAYMDDFDTYPIVSALDFSASDTYRVGGTNNCVYRSTGYTDNWVITFDYYLPEAPSGMMISCQQNNAFVGGENAFQNGFHSMRAEFAYSSSKAFVPQIFNLSKTVDQCYIWNVQVTQGGHVVKPVSDAMVSGVTAVEDKRLCEYEWYTTMRTDPPVTEIRYTDSVTTWDTGFHFSGGTTADYCFEMSFDYYLPKDFSSLGFSNFGATWNVVAGSATMKKTQGHHTFYVKAYDSLYGRLIPRITSTDATTMYIWNYSIKVNGVEKGVNSKITEAMPGTRGDRGQVLSAYDWSKTMDAPRVTIITAPESVTSGNYSWAVNSAKNFYYGGISPETAYTVSFEYYLPKDATTLNFASVSGWMKDESAHKELEKTAGYHTYTWTTYATGSYSTSGQFVPRIQADYATTIYLWNWSVKQNGVELAPSGNWSPNTTGTLGDYLTNYEWAASIGGGVEEETGTPVYKIDAENMLWSGDGFAQLFRDPSVVTDRTKCNGYVFSFDYYLAGESTYQVRARANDGNGNAMLADDATGSSILQPGRHTFSASFTVDGLGISTLMAPALYAYYGADYSAAKPANLYIWNWKLVATNGQVSRSLTNLTQCVGTATVGNFVKKVKLEDIETSFVEFDKKATEIDFSNAQVYTADGTAYTYAIGHLSWRALTTPRATATVRYYLPESAANTQMIYGLYDAETGKPITQGFTTLKSGYNTAQVSVNLNGVSRPYFAFRQAQAGAIVDGSTLTVWDFEVKATELNSADAKMVSLQDDLSEGMGWIPADKGITVKSVNVPQEPTLPEAGDVIYKFDFSSISGQTLARTDTNMLGNNNAGDVTKIKIKFKYFLGGDSYYVVSDNSQSTYVDSTTGQKHLVPGLHVFETTKEVSLSNYFFGIMASYKVDAVNRNSEYPLYIWDLEISGVANGQEKLVDTSNISWNQSFVTKVADYTTVPTILSPMMHEIKVDGSASVQFGGAMNVANKDNTNGYTLTFKYWMPNDGQTTAYLRDFSGSDSFITAGTLKDTTTASTYLQPGINTYTANLSIVTGGSQTLIPIALNISGKATIYIWDISLRANDGFGGVTGDNLYTGLAKKWVNAASSDYVTYDDRKFINPVLAYHFDFDNENFNVEYFTKEQALTNRSIFYATNVSSGASSGRFAISFDYYLPEATAIYVNNSNDTGRRVVDAATGSSFLQQGYHTFYSEFDITQYSGGSNTIFGFASPYDYWSDSADGTKDGYAYGNTLMPKDLYVWNFRFVNVTTGAERATGFASGFNGAGANCMSTVDMNEVDMAEKTEVVEIDFTTCPNYGDEDYEEGVYFTYMPFKTTIPYGLNGSANTYTVSFDYYIAESSAKICAFMAREDFENVDGSTALRNVAAGENNDYFMQPGRHTFVATFTGDQLKRGNPSLRFEAYANQANSVSKLYVWNLNVSCTSGADSEKANGNYVFGRPMLKTKNSTVTIRTNSVKKADLASTMELDMVGAQIRDDKALRFITAIKDAKITRSESGKAVFGDTATVTIGDKTYTVVGAGVLFGRDTKIATLGKAPEHALMLENVGGNEVYNINVTKLQAEDFATRYLDGSEGVVFTGVIPNIPQANWEDSLSTRAYLKVKLADGTEDVLYGEVISRSLTDENLKIQPNNLNPNEKMYSTPEMEQQANAMRDQILGAANVNLAAGTSVRNVYYVSPLGNDSNDGKSPTSAWRSLAKVNELSNGSYSSRNVVLFERGGEYRGQLKVKSYTSYGAYGSTELDKPLINASLMNYADMISLMQTGLEWVKLDEAYGNRWQLVGSGNYWASIANIIEVGNNVGNMYFFDENGEMIAYGTKSMDSSIYQDYEFYHKVDRVINDTDYPGWVESVTLGDLFVSLPAGKTPYDFSKIEIATKQSAVVSEGDGASYINIDNLQIRYAGNHGISFSSNVNNKSTSNVSITNCEIGWIGGSIMRYRDGTSSDYTDDVDVRLGNGIEFYGASNGITVKGNWIYQCYDAGYSNQGTGTVAQNITVSENLIEYCAYSMEVWESNTAGLLKNCSYVDNMLRFAGYEFERDNRIGGTYTAISHMNFMLRVQPCENVIVSGNIFDSTYVSMVTAAYPNSDEKNELNDGTSILSTYKNDMKGPKIYGNTWVMTKDRHSRVAYMRDTATTLNTILHGTSQAEMQQSVAQVDTAPAGIIFYN